MEQKSKVVGKHPAVIELNGQRFDALTGKSLSVGTPKIQTKPAMSDVRPVPQRTVSRKTTDSTRVHKTRSRSHTLMRHAVKKPDISPAVADSPKPFVAASHAQAPRTAFHHTSDDIRLKRAHQIRQNSLISRFGDVMNTPVHMPAVVSDIGGRKGIHQMDVKPEPVHRAEPKTIIKRNPADELTEKGLRAASSHKADKVKKPRLHHRIGKRIGLKPRAVSIGAGSLAVLVLGGFIAYQNVPNLAVRYASMKAGVDASLPTYQPAGFAINDRVKYSPGEVSVAYKANADDRTYTVTQKSSAWNDDSLKDYVASTSGKEPQSFPENGKTIYLYGDSNAAWIDSGVLYKISGDSSLNTDQLIKIASSLN